MQANIFTLTLKASYMITPNVKHFIFTLPQNHAFNFIAGQFITLYFNNENQKLHRSYSIANSPETSGVIEFAAGYIQDGPGTTFLFNLKPGDTVDANGPFGRLTLKEPAPKRYVLVATSTGVTPYRSMLPQLTQLLHETPLELVLLQGVQNREDILYHEEFKAFACQHQRVIYKACLSREKSPLLDFEEPGYVQDTFSKLNLSPNTDLVYLCGNPKMVDDSFEWLKTQGFSIQQIVREKYISR